jgi:hypothetical protein
MQVFPINRVMDKKRIIEKMEGQGGGGQSQGVADLPPPKKKSSAKKFGSMFETTPETNLIK